MLRVFVDTGAFVAAENRRDQHHAAAIELRDRIEAEGWAPITTSLVLAETVTFLGRRLGARSAFRFGMLLLSSRILEIVRPDARQEQASLALYRRRGDPDLSFTDALSLHVIRSREIEKVFAFDRHFDGCGAELLRA